MKKIWILIALITLGCSNNQRAEKPEKPIDPKTMESILYDLALLQALKGHNPNLISKNKIQTTTYIYQKYQIDSLQFAQNNAYYSSDMKAYIQMLDRVAKKITQEKNAVEPILKKEQQVKQQKAKDSILKQTKNKQKTNIAW